MVLLFRIFKMSFAVIIIILALIAFNYTEHTSVIQSVMLVFLGAVMFIQGLEERKKENDSSGAFNIYTAVFVWSVSLIGFTLYMI
ncbi:YczI family protein [Paraburkholderia tropica]